MSLPSVWPLLLSPHLPIMSKSLPTVASLLEHIGSKIWSAFSSCKCTKYQSSFCISFQTLQHFSFDHFYAYISLLCRLRLTQIFCIASFKAVGFWNQQSNHVIILFFTATFKLKVWKGFFSPESTYGLLFIHCCNSFPPLHSSLALSSYTFGITSWQLRFSARSSALCVLHGPMASLPPPKGLSHFIPSPFAALIAAGIFDPSLSLPFCCLSPAAFQHSTTVEFMPPDPHLTSLVSPHSLVPSIADGSHSPWILSWSLILSGTKRRSKSPDDQALAWSWRPEIRVTTDLLGTLLCPGELTNSNSSLLWKIHSLSKDIFTQLLEQCNIKYPDESRIGHGCSRFTASTKSGRQQYIIFGMIWFWSAHVVCWPLDTFLPVVAQTPSTDCEVWTLPQNKQANYTEDAKTWFHGLLKGRCHMCLLPVFRRLWPGDSLT